MKEKNKTMHLMVDLETLATTPDSVILTLGAVKFDPYDDKMGDTLYMKIVTEDQSDLGRVIDDNTVEWWSKQSPDVMLEAFDENDRIPFKDAMEKFRKFYWGCNRVWSHGLTFDVMILQNAFSQLNINSPWGYYDCRDTRTLFEIAKPNLINSSKHNALNDAISQAFGVQESYRNLGLKR